MSPDPLGEEYWSISPYAYCAGNPVDFVDPDGKKLYYAPGTSDKFKEQFSATIVYMNKKGTSGDIAKIHASPIVYYIAETDSPAGNSFTPGDNITIYWNPNNIIETDSGIWISPATALAHEADHAQEYDAAKRDETNTKAKALDAAKAPNSDPDYGTKEERRVITGTEQTAARKHGEIMDTQVTRTNHLMTNRKLSTNDASPEEISRAVYENNRLL